MSPFLGSAGCCVCHVNLMHPHEMLGANMNPQDKEKGLSWLPGSASPAPDCHKCCIFIPGVFLDGTLKISSPIPQKQLHSSSQTQIEELKKAHYKKRSLEGGKVHTSHTSVVLTNCAQEIHFSQKHSHNLFYFMRSVSELWVSANSCRSVYLGKTWGSLWEVTAPQKHTWE